LEKIGSGGSFRQCNPGRYGDAPSRDRLIPTMAMTSATLAFFLDVCDFAVRGDFPVFADHASAGKGCEAKEPDETHHDSASTNAIVM